MFDCELFALFGMYVLDFRFVALFEIHHSICALIVLFVILLYFVCDCSICDVERFGNDTCECDVNLRNVSDTGTQERHLL